VPPEQQLILLYDQDARDLPLRAEDIVDSVAGGQASSLAAQARGRLMNPHHARFLIQRRMQEEQRERWTIENVEERLQRYVVLDYPTEAAAAAALQRLSRDPNVLSVETNQPVELSVAPSEPLFAPLSGATSPFNYQWGIHDRLELYGAWDITRGTAYVGVVDTGIEVNHPDLQQSYRPQFARNVTSSSRAYDIDERSENHPRPGHGTHVAGIIAAGSHDPSDTSSGNNSPSAGGAGVCWRCSVITARASFYDQINRKLVMTMAWVASGVVHAVQNGSQAVNLSFGVEGTPSPNCGDVATSAMCDAMELASRYDVVMVGATGNENHSIDVQFPASDPRVIPVAGLQHGTPDLWQNTEVNGAGAPIAFGSRLGPQMAQRGLLAPARDVLSTVYTGYDWNPAGRCGDSTSLGSSAGPGYGVCTGTSMAAPHVTGIVALMRSVDPLQSAGTVRSRLLSTADNAHAPNNQRGYGVPSARLAVNTMVSDNSVKLTPLFALQDGCNGRWLYTVAPQMAAAAINRTLLPSPGAYCKIFPAFQTWGSQVKIGATFYAFPGVDAQTYPARAQVWLYSTHKPRNSAVELMPLYRLSRESDFQRAYTSSYSEAQALVFAHGYRIDGTEGYLYPANLSPPSGTVRLRRASKQPSGTSDFAVFPESLEASMASQGYVYGLTTLGWAFPNTGKRPVY
jgi:serine protease